jgi:cell division protein FtsL
MAKKRVGARGRTWAALILLGFVLVATSVIQRRTLGIRHARENKQLEQQLQALESRKVAIEAEIEAAKGRNRIAPLVEKKLGMRAPTEKQIVTIHK